MADLFQSFVEFWVDLVLLVPRLIVWGASEMMAAFVSSWSIESQFVDPMAFENGFTSDLIFFISVFEVPTGLGFIVSALVMRFVLRRMPVIG